MRLRIPYVEVGWSFWITGRKKPPAVPPIQPDRGASDDEEDFGILD